MILLLALSYISLVLMKRLRAARLLTFNRAHRARLVLTPLVWPDNNPRAYT